jgi:hypothetical protein
LQLVRQQTQSGGGSPQSKAFGYAPRRSRFGVLREIAALGLRDRLAAKEVGWFAVIGQRRKSGDGSPQSKAFG